MVFITTIYIEQRTLMKRRLGWKGIELRFYFYFFIFREI